MSLLGLEEQTDLLQRFTKSEADRVIKLVNAHNTSNEFSEQQQRSRHQHQTIGRLSQMSKTQNELEKSAQKQVKVSEKIQEDLQNVQRQLGEMLEYQKAARQSSDLKSNSSESNANEKPCDAIEVEDMTTSTSASTTYSIDSFEQPGVANTPTGKTMSSLFRNGTPGASSSRLPPKTPSTSTRRSARPPLSSSRRNRNEEAEESYRKSRARRLEADRAERAMQMSSPVTHHK